MDSIHKSVYSRPALGIKGQRPMGLGAPEDKSFPEGPQSWEGQSLGKDAGGGGGKEAGFMAFPLQLETKADSCVLREQSGPTLPSGWS